MEYGKPRSDRENPFAVQEQQEWMISPEGEKIARGTCATIVRLHE